MDDLPRHPSQSLTDESDNPQLSVERRRRIVELAVAEGSVRVGALSQRFGVSEVTIRADLRALAADGALLRTRGGAIAQTETLSTAFGLRAHYNHAQKQLIGRAAAALVRPGDTILLDAGTTAMEMAKNLPPTLSPLTVVTNALNVAMHIGSMPGAKVILAGGSLNAETISTLGMLAERDLSDLMVDKLFLGAHSLDALMGVADLSVEIARVKSAMIRASREVILLADSSKWGRSAVARVAPLSAIHTWITDKGLSEEVRSAVAKFDIRLVEV
jgi:DeoR family transcriptional regulator of aga operon